MDWLLPFYDVQHDKIGTGIWIPVWDDEEGFWSPMWLPLADGFIGKLVQIPLFLIF